MYVEMKYVKNKRVYYTLNHIKQQKKQKKRCVRNVNKKTDNKIYNSGKHDSVMLKMVLGYTYYNRSIG